MTLLVHTRATTWFSPRILTCILLLVASFGGKYLAGAGAVTTCQVCGCDECVGSVYDEMGNPDAFIPIPAELQTGALTGVTELQCHWLTYGVDMFLAGLDFCTDDALRLQGEFREICGCADPPNGVETTNGSFADALADMVEHPTCNVCGGGEDSTLHVDEELSATFTVPPDKITIFPDSVLKDAVRLDNGSAVIQCRSVEMAGWYEHFSAENCAAISKLAEFRDGCTCASPENDDDFVCDLCGCAGCPPFAFKMSNPTGSIQIPEELHESTMGITEIHCWMIDFAVKQGGVAEDDCRAFQTFELFRETCGCPPLPTTNTANTANTTDVPKPDTDTDTDSDEPADTTNELTDSDVVLDKERNNKSTGRVIAIVVSLFAVAVVALLAIVIFNKNNKKSIVTKTIAMAAPDEVTMNDSLDSSAPSALSPKTIFI
jgi:hypothetical protein